MKLFYRQSGPSFTHKITGQFIEKPKVLIHLCMHEGCEAWGSHSIGARWKDGVPGRWYCAEHIKEAETSQAHDAPVMKTEAADDNEGAGDLFAGA